MGRGPHATSKKKKTFDENNTEMKGERKAIARANLLGISRPPLLETNLSCD